MIVQAVCLPVGSKTLVIPIFFPMIPFIFLRFFPQGCTRQTIKIGLQSWFIADLFPLPPQPLEGGFYFKRAAIVPDSCPRDAGSTGDKHTSKGLFIFYGGGENSDPLILLRISELFFHICEDMIER